MQATGLAGVCVRWDAVRELLDEGLVLFWDHLVVEAEVDGDLDPVVKRVLQSGLPCHFLCLSCHWFSLRGQRFWVQELGLKRGKRWSRRITNTVYSPFYTNLYILHSIRNLHILHAVRNHYTLHSIRNHTHFIRPWTHQINASRMLTASTEL